MKNHLYTIVFLMFLCLGMYGCTPSVREARQVMAQADSLRAEGGMYSDSVTLAQAYESLYTFRYLYPTDFAHSCYHYGRLLREKENPVAAMECFIRATHSRTRDYHILGRVYNNIGEISYLANEFQLSYDMYSKAAELFVNNGDSLYFCYSLYRMAYAKAVLGENNRTDSILQIIANARIDNPTLTSYSYITYAEKHLHNQYYDSVIYFAHQALHYNWQEHMPRILLAQAFSYLGKKDSAVYYAKQVLDSSNDLGNQNNALYILTNDDITKDLEFVRQTAAERADIQKLIEIRQGKLSQAVQLLEQDLQRKPDWRGYALAIVIAMGVVASVVSIRVGRRRKKQMNKQVSSLADQQADTIIESIKKHIDISDLEDTLHWKDYNAMKSDADLYMGGIVSKLEAHHLNEVEIRFCVLTVLDFSLKQIADTIHYGYPSGIKTLKKRTADKLSTTPPKLRDFLLHLLPKT